MSERISINYFKYISIFNIHLSRERIFNNLDLYSHELHNDISEDGRHIQWWSHEIMMELKNSYCLATS